MRRVIVPALLAIAMVAGSSANANAFGLFDKLCGGGGCDTGCAAEPACGCEAACEPACGCEAACAPACEPACGCEVVDPCCDSGCGGKKTGLLKKLFGKLHRNGCDSGCAAACEPACGCETACAPACEPACGCEVVDPCCDSGCGGRKRGGLLKKLFGNLHKGGCDNGCAAACEPACGCEVAAACGGCAAEPTCGCEPSCGCGN